MRVADVGPDAGVGVGEGPAARGAEDADGRGEAVGCDAVGGDDGNSDAVGEAQTGAGINYMGVAPATDLDVLLGVAAR